MSTIKSSAENLTLNADGANNDIIFQSNGSNVATLDQAGNVIAAGTISSTGNTTITSGNLIIGTAGKGIDFSAQTSANSVSGVTTGDEVLNHYEEGTWTPTASNLSAASGSYTKIGNKVFCQAYVAASGATTINFLGMPFTAIGNAGSGGGSGGGIVNYHSRNSTEAWQVYANAIPVGFTMYLGAGNKQLQNGEVAYVVFSYNTA